MQSQKQHGGDKKGRTMNPFIQLKQTTSLFFVAFGLVCFGLSTAVQAVSPAPDGGYPGGNTAEGQNALLSLTTGGYNTAVGFLSLRSNTDGSFNTAVGAGTLPFNIGDQSTGDGIQNTAIGTAALLSNTIGASNTATGVGALLSNTIGNFNTANGEVALVSNTTGEANTASGIQALHNNTTGSDNTALGTAALYDSTTGSDNIAVGAFAGMNVTTAHNTICIGTFGNNVDDSCYIASIFNATSSGGTPVYTNEHRSSSRRGCTEDLTDIATIAYILATRPDTDNVIGYGNPSASFIAQGDIFPAGRVIIERLKPMAVLPPVMLLKSA
jgi:hypothetical protein